MGADFLYTVIPNCELTLTRKKRIKDLIRNTEDKYLTEIVENYYPFGLDEEGGASQIRVTLYKAVLEGVGLDNRETAPIQLDGMDWEGTITGGMSWGDPPTEAFDVLAGIYYFDSLWDLLLEFSREDLVIQRNRTTFNQNSRGGENGT